MTERDHSVPTEKRCSKCGVVKPKTEFFRTGSKRGRPSDEFHPRCKTCQAQVNRERTLRLGGRPRLGLDTATGDAVCARCKQTKPLTSFFRQRNRKNGHACYCKTCMVAAAAAWTASNVERHKETCRMWLAGARRPRPKKKGPLLKQDKQRQKELHRLWRERNPESDRKRGERRRLRLAGNRVEPVSDEWLAVLRRDPCSYCGGIGGALEHVVSVKDGGAHSADNLASVCIHCNSSKHATPLLMWLVRAAVAAPTEWKVRAVRC